MIKKICPICDSELKNGNYCSVCRKVVRRPKVEERNYYLNERRPGSGTQEGTSRLGGHTEPASGTSSPAESPYVQKQVREAEPGKQRIPTALSDYEGKGKAQPVYRPAQKKAGGGRTSPVGKIVLALFLFIAAVNLLIGFLNFAPGRALLSQNEVNLEVGPIWEIGENGEEDFGYEVYELEPSQLRAAGAGCDFYPHADMDEESAKSLAESFLTEYGIEDFRIEQEDFNRRYVYADGEESTIYDTCLTYLPGAEAAGDTENEDFCEISIGFDTGNGQLHYFEFSSGNIDFAAQAAERFAGAMDRLDHSVSVEPEVIRASVLALQYAEPENYEDDLWLRGDNWSIYGYKENDGVYYFTVTSGGSDDEFDLDIEIQEG